MWALATGEAGDAAFSYNTLRGVVKHDPAFYFRYAGDTKTKPHLNGRWVWFWFTASE